MDAGQPLDQGCRPRRGVGGGTGHPEPLGWFRDNRDLAAIETGLGAAAFDASGQPVSTHVDTMGCRRQDSERSGWSNKSAQQQGTGAVRRPDAMSASAEEKRMKLGLGLYRHMLDDAHFAFARQCGATHIIVHMCDYFRGRTGAARSDQPVGDASGWGIAEGRLWTVDELSALREAMAGHGLTFFAIENFDPGQWYDILFDGPRRDEQMAMVCQLIRNVGAAGVGVFGYNFSLAGVAGRVTTNLARGRAPSVGLDGRNEQTESPLPASMAWNMVVDEEATGIRPAVSPDELWARLAWFLERILPVAEEAGVVMAAHPDDPPLDLVRGQPRLVYRPQLYQRLLDIHPSPANALEFCLGTIAEMSEGDVYATVERHAKQGRIAYMHLRNVRGRVPHYHETFIDEGDVDVARVVRILDESGFDGVLTPDHAPQMSCAAPWHAGMAFAMGYINALLKLSTADDPGRADAARAA